VVVACSIVALALGAAACGDDDEAQPVSQETWDEQAAELCESTGVYLQRAYTEEVPDSDAQEVAFYRTELVPRVRGLVNHLALLGFPPDQDAAYRAGLNQVLDALNRLELEPYEYIDERHEGIDPEDDLITLVQQGLAAADVPC
jgi:hypothetical protein